jgi:hypothetical protein
MTLQMRHFHRNTIAQSAAGVMSIPLDLSLHFVLYPQRSNRIFGYMIIRELRGIPALPLRVQNSPIHLLRLPDVVLFHGIISPLLSGHFFTLLLLP